MGGGGGGTQRKGTGMSTTEKEATLQKCLNTFVPHCLNAKLCYCTQVKPCMTMILTEITGINDLIMLLAVTTTQMLSPRPDRVSARDAHGSTRLSNNIHFVHFIVRKLEIRMKMYKFLLINKQFCPN